MPTPHEVAAEVQSILGIGSLVTYSEGFIDIDYSFGHKQIKIFIEPDGWDIYTTMHGLMWGGDLTQRPPQDIIDKVQSYLATFG